MWARRSVVPISTGARRRAVLGGVFRISETSIGVVAADAAGSVKVGVGAVGIDMDLDPRLDEMGPHQAFGDLQFQRPVGDAIVMSDLPLLLDAENLVEVDAWDGREGRALAGPIPSALDDTVERASIILPRRVLRRLDEEARAAGETGSGYIAKLAMGR